MQFDDAIRILEGIRATFELSPADVAAAMEIVLRSRGVDECEIGRSVGRWYGLLFKNRERLLESLLESPPT